MQPEMFLMFISQTYMYEDTKAGCSIISSHIQQLRKCKGNVLSNTLKEPLA